MLNFKTGMIVLYSKSSARGIQFSCYIISGIDEYNYLFKITLAARLEVHITCRGFVFHVSPESRAVIQMSKNNCIDIFLQ